MNPETVNVAQLRAHVALHEPYLREHPIRDQVRQRAVGVASALIGEHSPLIAKARALPPAQSLVAPRGVSTPNARDDHFNRAVDDFIGECYAAIDSLENFQQRIKANESLDDDDVVAAVLAEAVKTEDAQWNESVSWNAGLPALRVRDALEELSHQGAIDINERSRSGTDAFLFTVTAYGRRLARGTAKPRGIVPIIQLNQHISDSTIASAGISYGDVTQDITVNADVREIIDALAQFQAALGDDAHTVAAGALAERAASELRANGWTDTAGALLRAIPVTLGGLTAFAANVQPAYAAIAALAAVHGYILPPFP